MYRNSSSFSGARGIQQKLPLRRELECDCTQKPQRLPFQHATGAHFALSIQPESDLFYKVWVSPTSFGQDILPRFPSFEALEKA